MLAQDSVHNSGLFQGEPLRLRPLGNLNPTLQHCRVLSLRRRGQHVLRQHCAQEQLRLRGHPPRFVSGINPVLFLLLHLPSHFSLPSILPCKQKEGGGREEGGREGGREGGKPLSSWVSFLFNSPE